MKNDDKERVAKGFLKEILPSRAESGGKEKFREVHPLVGKRKGKSLRIFPRGGNPR